MARRHRRRPTPEPVHAPAPRTRNDGGDWLIAGLAALGMLVTGYLTAVAGGDGAPAFCVDGGGCDLIQRSQWSRLLGLPVALWGFATYALLVLLSLAPMTRARRWRRCFSVALVGVAISVYLTLAGLIALDALCPWCLLSLALICTIFALVLWRRPLSQPESGWSSWLLGHGLFTGVLLLALHLNWIGLFEPRPDPRLQALAEHLTASGAKFYGASWCPACREQKAMFGGAAASLPYVECSPAGRSGPMAMECALADVRGYPTWVIRGRAYDHVMAPDELARRSGYRGPAVPAAAEEQ